MPTIYEYEIFEEQDDQTFTLTLREKSAGGWEVVSFTQRASLEGVTNVALIKRKVEKPATVTFRRISGV